jgi:RNA polymerase sigma-54 factor
VDLAQHVRMSATPSASTVLSATLLSLPAAALDDVVERELVRNPALERRPRCLRCGRRGAPAGCAACRGLPPRVEAGDRAAVPGWREALEQEALLVAPRRAGPAVRVVVASLSEHGLLLGVSLPELVALSGSSATDVVAAIEAVREAGPPGIAATSAQGCLLAQLEASTAGTAVERRLASSIVTLYLELLAAGDLSAIATRTGAGANEVARAVALVHEQCRPWPVTESSDAPPRRPPDVLIELSGPPGARRAVARCNDAWRDEIEISNEMVALARTGAPDGRRFAAELVTSARTFLLALRRRSATIETVAQAAADFHLDSLLSGSLAFRSLTRRQLAYALRMHESSVGRAVQQRTVRLPSGHVVPFSRLFGSGHDVRQRLAELCTVPTAMSDRQLREVLAADGVEVSRRTVAKYRAQLGLTRRAAKPASPVPSG